jgi:hypothetical protein
MVVKSRIDDTRMVRIVIFRGGSHGVRKKSGSTHCAGRSAKKDY